jgi:hypothetical protein
MIPIINAGFFSDQLIKIPQVYYYLISNYDKPVVLADMVWCVSSMLPHTSQPHPFN